MLKIIKKYKYLITFIFIIVIICFCIIRSKKLKENNKEYAIQKSSNVIVNEIKREDEQEGIKKIKIDIKGQVNNPGVYELEESSRVIDAINVSGGLTEIANTSLINLSKKLEDQMVILIYSDEEVLNSNVKEIETVFKVIEKECNCPNIKNDSCINTEFDNTDTGDNIEVININTASLEELMKLPSVGESKAKAIIEYREENNFIKVEDIMNVSGIGEALFEKIKEYISV